MPGPLVLQERQPVAWDNENEQGSLELIEKTEVTGFAEVGVEMWERKESKNSL